MIEKKAKEHKQTLGKKQPTLEIQRIFVKDLSLESPQAPKIFTRQFSPEIKVDLNVKHEEITKGIYEVILFISASAQEGGKTVFLVEVHQAGVFHVDGFEKQQMDHFLESYCPSVLFPYAREVVADVVNKAGFPQLNLSPINFDVVYMQKKQMSEEKEDKNVH